MCRCPQYHPGTYDTPDTLFYVDPPYYNSDCGHYDGYTIDDYEALLKALTRIEGKFMFSSYPSPRDTASVAF